MLSKGIPAPVGLQRSQDSISRSALRRVAVLMRITFCCSGVGSKKSRDMARLLSLLAVIVFRPTPSLRPATAMQCLMSRYYDQNQDSRCKRDDGVRRLLTV